MRPRLLAFAAPLFLAGCAQFATPLAEPASTQAAQGSSSQPVSAAPPAGAAEPAPNALPPSPADDAPKAKVQDDLRPELPTVDFDAPGAETDLWARVRDGLLQDRLDPLEGDRVAKWERYYASRPDYVARMTERGGRYLFHIVEEVERRGLPMELALLPFIESAFNPEAMSKAKASGMWQFMSATGRDFDLKQNLFRDDRRDVLASTRAALDYLAQLGRRYDGDWQLALAAYNWGMGNVDRAVKRARAQGRDGRYVELRMPAETADYVPKLQAVKNIVMRPADYALSLPVLHNHPYFLTVQIERDIDVELAARLAGLSVDVFRQFNPQMNKPVVLAAATPQLLLPYENAERFARELAGYQGPLASWTAMQVARTLKPSEAAKLAGMSESELRAVNRINGRLLIKAGSTLLVPRTAKRDHDVSEHLADTASLALAPERRMARRLVKARKGDTVALLAKRHGVTVAQVLDWNSSLQTAGARLKAGQSVALMKPVRAVAKKSTAGKKPVRAVAKAKNARQPVRAAAKKATPTARVAQAQRDKKS